MFCRPLIPDFQAPAMGGNRDPHIFACQALADFPSFIVRTPMVPFGLTFRIIMKPPGSNGQGSGQVAYLPSRQVAFAFAALRLVGRQARQGRGCRVGQIPADKSRTGSFDLPHRPLNSSTSPLRSGSARGLTTGHFLEKGDG